MPTDEKPQRKQPSEDQVIEKVREITGAIGLGFNEILGRAYYTDLLRRAGWRWAPCENQYCDNGEVLEGDQEQTCAACSGERGRWEKA